MCSIPMLGTGMPSRCVIAANSSLQTRTCSRPQGSAGTMFFEDTVGFHRRLTPMQRRVMLNILYASLIEVGSAEAGSCRNTRTMCFRVGFLDTEGSYWAIPWTRSSSGSSQESGPVAARLCKCDVALRHRLAKTPTECPMKYAYPTASSCGIRRQSRGDWRRRFAARRLGGTS